MPEVIRINDRISYIKASTEPLSSDVILIEGDEYAYFFDVGNNEEVAEYLEELPKKKKIILSHFHQDHMGNIGKLDCDLVYVGKGTEKYLEETMSCQVLCEPMSIRDGVELEIHPVPNSHAKGSLVLMVDKEYLFLGDSLYSKVQDDKYVYNAQLLKEEIELLKRLSAETVFSCHEVRPLKRKDGMIRFLEQIYAKREAGEPYIRISRESGKM